MRGGSGGKLRGGPEEEGGTVASGGSGAGLEAGASAADLAVDVAAAARVEERDDSPRRELRAGGCSVIT